MVNSNPANIRSVFLEDIYQKVPVISSDAVGFYKENCMISFDHNGHASGVELNVNYLNQNYEFKIVWNGSVTEQLRRSYQDLPKVADFAACAIVLSILSELTDFIVIEQSILGTTIDYYLADKNKVDDHLIFNKSARLEVSGILKENENNTVEKRIKAKINRLKPQQDFSDYIAVIEFSKPWSKIIKA